MGRHIEVIARGLAVHGGRVLLCRDLEGAYYFLPGGHVEYDEPAPAALRREFMEETGLDVEVGRMLSASEHRFLQRGRRCHEVNLVFHVARAEGWPDPIPRLEPHIRFDWLDAAELTEIDYRPASMLEWLLTCLGARAS